MFFFLEPIAWELKNSKCFFMVLLFELIKKNFTSFGPVSVFSICPPEEELESVALWEKFN